MSNLFTRHHYDINEQNLFNKSNNDTSLYMLNSEVTENTSACYASVGFINGQSQVARPMTTENMMDLGTKTDIETRLQNRHKELNSFERTNKDYEKFKTTIPTECLTSNNITNEDSRFTNPIDYSFTPYLFINLQEPIIQDTTFESLNRGGSSSRYESKKQKFTLKPKEFATAPVNNLDLYNGLLPLNLPVVPAYKQTDSF